MKSKPWLVVLFCLSLALTGCVSTGASNPTAVPTSTAAPTATLTPTPAPTPTPQPTVDLFVIDPAKFHSFPESYEYLLAHLDEFVQAPDPVNNRAAFDNWWNGEFIPALGPVSDREPNINGGFGSSRYMFEFGSGGNHRPVIGELHSFYFVSNSIVYFVPCFHIEMNAINPEYRDMTACVALFDHPVLQRSDVGNIVIGRIAKGGRVTLGNILFNPKKDRPDIDYGEMDSIIMSIGGDFSDDVNAVRFGFGWIQVLAP